MNPNYVTNTFRKFDHIKYPKFRVLLPQRRSGGKQVQQWSRGNLENSNKYLFEYHYVIRMRL